MSKVPYLKMPHPGALPYTDDPTPTHRPITNNPIQHKPIYILAYLGSIMTTKSYTKSICREKKCTIQVKLWNLYMYINVNCDTIRIEGCMTTNVSKLDLCR
jgi:hypothetical protein